MYSWTIVNVNMMAGSEESNLYNESLKPLKEAAAALKLESNIVEAIVELANAPQHLKQIEHYKKKELLCCLTFWPTLEG